MADPKRGQPTPEKSGQKEGQETTRRETERKEENNPAPHKKDDSGSNRESRQM